MRTEEIGGHLNIMEYYVNLLLTHEEVDTERVLDYLNLILKRVQYAKGVVERLEEAKYE